MAPRNLLHTGTYTALFAAVLTWGGGRFEDVTVAGAVGDRSRRSA
jgi:hypothetical protein